MNINECIQCKKYLENKKNEQSNIEGEYLQIISPDEKTKIWQHSVTKEIRFIPPLSINYLNDRIDEMKKEIDMLKKRKLKTLRMNTILAEGIKFTSDYQQTFGLPVKIPDECFNLLITVNFAHGNTTGQGYKTLKGSLKQTGTNDTKDIVNFKYNGCNVYCNTGNDEYIVPFNHELNNNSIDVNFSRDYTDADLTIYIKFAGIMIYS